MRTCNDVTASLISTVTTIIMVIANPIFCNANRRAPEFIIRTFDCCKAEKYICEEISFA